MNTDIILDFIVEYYIWFIIGGSVLILAIIGFVADKKKLLPNNKKKNDDNKEVTNNEIHEGSNHENEIAQLENDSESKKLGESIGYGITESFDGINLEKDNYVNDSVESSNDFSEENHNALNDEFNSFKNDNFENEKSEIEFTENNYITDDNNAKLTFNDMIESVEPDINVENVGFNVEENFDNDMEPTIETININNEDFFQENKLPIVDLTEENNENEENKQTLTTSDDDKYNMYENLESANLKINEFASQNDGLSLSQVDETIDKINNFDFSVDDKKDELEDTMQISYSQLKELVEDIIEENEKGKNKNIEIDNDIKFSNLETIDDSQIMDYNDDTNMSLPKLDSNIIENIKTQDDEDDVWKF